jgi:hypothetical protein
VPCLQSIDRLGRDRRLCAPTGYETAVEAIDPDTHLRAKRSRSTSPYVYQRHERDWDARRKRVTGMAQDCQGIIRDELASWPAYFDYLTMRLH